MTDQADEQDRRIVAGVDGSTNRSGTSGPRPAAAPIDASAP